MAATREQVFQAIFALLQGLPGIVSTSRRFALPGQVAPGDQPALMLWEQHEEAGRESPTPANRVWGAWIVIVFTNPDKTVAGATIINPILDAIEAALKSDNVAHDTLTLGGLVHYCRIEGATIKETGDTDSNGLGGAVVPLLIRVP